MTSGAARISEWWEGWRGFGAEPIAAGDHWEFGGFAAGRCRKQEGLGTELPALRDLCNFSI